MTSLASKKKKVHRTLITELNKRFPTVEPTGSPPSLNQISLNYSQANNQNDQNNLSTTTKTILEEEGIIEKVIAFQNSAEQRKKFWPDSSFNSLEHLNGSINKSSNQKNNSQVQLINECIKNKDKWVDVKSISREIEENMNKNLEKIKNETDSKKSSIYCSEKINEVESENEEEEKKISFNLKEALEGNLKEALEDNLKSASKINNGSKSSFYSRSKTEKNKENATNNEGSVIETEKLRPKPEEIDKFLAKKNQLIKQKTLRQNYSKNSFFIFSLNSNLRKLIISVIESNHFQIIVRIFLLINIIAFIIRYYHEHSIDSSDICIIVSFYIEIICNFFFLLEISLRIMAMGFFLESKTFLRDPFQFLDFIITVASFLQYISFQHIQKLGRVLRMLRPFRVFESFHQLRKCIVALLDSLIFISKYMSTLCFLIIFFAILGLHLFKGATEYRCRYTELPTNATYWPADPNLKYLCGATECPSNRYCGSPADYGVESQLGELQYESLEFGILNFDNFFNSCLTNLTFLTFTGWGMATNLFWRNIHPYIFGLYSLSQVFIIGLIYLNMVLAEFYQSFVLSKSGQLRKEFRENSNDSKASLIFKSLKTAIENARKNQRRKSFYRRKSSHIPDFAMLKQLEFKENESTFTARNKDLMIVIDILTHNRFLKEFFIICSFLNIFLLIIDSIWFFYIPELDLIINNIDLSFTILFILEIIFALLHYGPKAYWEKTSLQKFDLIICSFVTAGLVLEINSGYFYENPNYELKAFFMSVKLLRIFKMMVKSKLGFFKSIGKMTHELIKSIMETGDYIIIISIFLLVCSLVGIEILYCDEICLVNEKALLIFHRYNYNTFWSSIMSTYMIFINEEWHLLVIDYWKLKGWYYIIFFVVILFVCQLFIMKMFTALLINHFCRSTNIKYLIKYSQDDQYFLPKFWKNKFKALYTTIKQFIFKILSCFYTIITKYFIKEKTEIRVTSKQNENLKKAINTNKLRTTTVHKSVKIAEHCNTVSNFGDLHKITHARENDRQEEENESEIKKDEIETTPINSSRNRKLIEIAKFEFDLMEKENSKTPITPISEEKLENEDSNHDPFKLSQSNIINPLQSPNFAVNPTGNKQKLDKKNEIFHSQVSANINALKSFKNKSSCLKQLTNAEPAKMKSMDSKSGTSYAFQFSSILDSNADLQSEMKTEKIIKENKGRSLFIFSPKNRIRIVCRKILKYFAIQDFILCMVVGSCIALSLKDPFASPDSEINLGLRQIEIFFFIFFLFEFIIKLVAFGFLWNGSNSCLRNFEGLIDFFILLLNVYEFSNGLSSNFKALRMLKFFFIGPYRRSLKIVIKTVLLSFPNLMKIGIITVYIMFFFSFFAVKVLKNRFYVCENVNLKEYNLQTKYDCLDYGGDWIKKDFTYDNIAAGIFRLFAICNTEGWTALSYDSIDARGIDELPLENNNKYWNLFYFFYFTTSNLIIFNVLIGILVEKYFQVKLKENKFHLLNEEQREWAHIRKSILKMKLMKKKKPPKFCLSHFVYRMNSSKIYSCFFTSCNLLNTFLYMLYWHRQDDDVQEVLKLINYVFTLVFALELILAFIMKGFHIFSSYWRLFDISIVVFSFFVETLTIIGVIKLDKLISSFASITQVFRVLKIIGKIEFLKKIFITIKCVLPQATNLLILLIIFMVMYSLIGIELFAYLKPQKYVNGIDIHFQNAYFSFYSLMRVVTTDGWFTIMADCGRARQPNFPCFSVKTYEDYQNYGFGDCGSPYSWLYFFSFDIIVVRIILNLFIAMLLAAAEEIVRIEKSSIGRYQLDKIKDLWLEYDPDGHGYISYKDFWKFSSQIAIIFGVDQGDLLSVENRTNFLKILEIPVFENVADKIFCYKFHDVVVKLAKVSIILKYGVTDLEVFGEKNKKNDKKRFKCWQNKNVEQFNETIYFSGDMAYLCRVLVNFKRWRDTCSPDSKKNRKSIFQPEQPLLRPNKIFDIKSLIERIKINIEIENQQEAELLKNEAVQIVQMEENSKNNC